MTTLDELVAEVAVLRQRLAATEAVLAIHQLKARYGELVDSRFARGALVDPSTLDSLAMAAAELFTEDAAWDGGPTLGVAVGRDAIADRLRAPTLTFSRHLFVKPRIDVDPPRASGRWDLISPCRTPDGRSWWMVGYEDDEYRLEDGVWRHSSMRLTTLVMSPLDEEAFRILA
ncbi:MAG TPA: nuclear transport factor 2 family protein [Acidimicrobiales bacterium]|nr:nuclear transport factor 2 family protein [Acidimicrobiales bacterium]